MNQGPTVVSRMYELPRLFGVWVLDPEYREALELSTGETVHPAAQIYLPQHVVQLNIEREGRFRKRLVTAARYLAYAIEGPEMGLAPIIETKDGKATLGDQTMVAWAITDDLRLNVNINGQWWRFVPTDLEGLRREGFDDEVLDAVLETARQSNVTVRESFDLAEAEKLIEEEGE